MLTILLDLFFGLCLLAWLALATAGVVLAVGMLFKFALALGRAMRRSPRLDPAAAGGWGHHDSQFLRASGIKR